MQLLSKAELINQFPESIRLIVKRLDSSLHNKGGKAYLVGGAVRDACLGIPVNDVDIEVFGVSATQLEIILSEIGPFDSYGKSFGIYKLRGSPIDIALPRKETKKGSGHRGFSIECDPNLTIDKAALRRDFTINSLYFNISEQLIIDPMGGIDDLKSGILNPCSEKFKEDPLRVLRAMQFIARFGLNPSSTCIAFCKKMEPEQIAKERFLPEWKKFFLKGKFLSAGLQFLRTVGWVKYYPELDKTIDCVQDPRWHPEGDVWNHTLHCLDAFTECDFKNDEDRLITGLATLCHDFGKPLTTKKGNDGIIHAHGHEIAGVLPTKSFCNTIGVKENQIEVICNLVKTHMRPHQLFAQKSSSAAIRRLANDVGRLDLLLALYYADSGGRPPLQNESPTAIQWIKEKASSLGVVNSKPKPLLRGRDLVKAGLTPSPRFKRILDQAFNAQLDGEIDSHKSAVEWLKKNLQNQKS